MEPGIADTVTIRPPGRLHLTLIGMDSNGYRSNGGVGFAIANPSVELRMSKSSTMIIADHREVPLSPEGEYRLVTALRRCKRDREMRSDLSVEIGGQASSHMGFGTGTSIRMGCIEGLFILNGMQYTPQMVRDSSGRGGTSGIGINTYFTGGFIFDIGHCDARTLTSSSWKENSVHAPLMVVQSSMPSWEVGMCVPTNL